MAEQRNFLEQYSMLLTGNKRMCLGDYSASMIVLYFYPKASTPGCTTESIDFGEFYPSFKKMGVEVLGVSRDSLVRQENFKQKYGFPFDLVADTDEVLCQHFDVIKQKSMYGKTFMGIERSTFIVDLSGKVIHEWRKVKVKGHAEMVLGYLSEFSNG